MLGKLIKHDMRSISKSAVPMFIASGIVSVICCAMLYFTYGFMEEINSMFGAVLVTGGFYILGITAIFAMWAIVAFLAISRYYKSLFTDEGYLNMVLPVKTSTVFNAKLLSVFIWIAIASVTAVACVFISLVLPTLLYDSSMITDTVSGAQMGQTEPAGIFMDISKTVDLITVFTSFVKSIVLVITAITIGATVMKRNKIFGSILFYFIISFIEEALTSGAEKIFELCYESNSDVGAMLTSVFALIVSIAITVGMYFIGLSVLKNKFNIE